MPKSVVEELECRGALVTIILPMYGPHASLCYVYHLERWIFVLLMGLRVFLWIRLSNGCKGKSLRESLKRLSSHEATLRI